MPALFDTPVVSTKTMALKAVLSELDALRCSAVQEFLALSESDQTAVYHSIITPTDAATLTPAERHEKIWQVLTHHKVLKVAEAVHARLLDALYRSSFKGSGIGFHTARTKALGGQRAYLLNLVKLFPDGQVSDGQLGKVVLDKLKTDSGFDRLYRKAIGSKPTTDHRAKKYESTLLYLCLNIDLVEAYRDGRLSIYDLYNKIYELSLEAPDIGLPYDQAAFAKWLRRSFRDILK